MVKLLRFKLMLLMAMVLMGASNVWGAKITDYTQIVSGKTYYIGATTGGNDYYLSVDGTTAGSTLIAGTAVTNKESATTFVFEGSSTSWTIKFSSGNYLNLSSKKNNGKVLVSSSAATFTLSNVSSKIRLQIGDYSVQKNNSGTQFGSYANSQTDIWLEEYVVNSPLASIAVDATGAKTVFHVGDAFTHEGATVTATYEDSNTNDVTEYATFSTPDMTTAGTKTVTVSYTENKVEKTTSYDIEVKAPISITLSGSYPTEFYQGGEFSTEGIVVTANYDDESTKDVTGEATFSEPDMTQIGEQTITVSYNGKDVKYTINVEEYVMPSKLIVDFEDNLSTYTEWIFDNIGTTNTAISAHGGSKYGATINASGNGVAACSITTKNKVNPESITFYVSKASANTTASSWYVEVSENGTKWTQVGDAVDAKSMSKGAWNTVSRKLSDYSNVYVRIRYNGSTAIRTIDDISLEMATATSKVLTEITLGGTYPTVLTQNKTFSAAGIVVTAHFDDDTESDVTADAEFSGYDMATLGEQEVTVSYTRNEVTKTATYNITIVEQKGTETNPYTVAEARAAIDANEDITGVYAAGIVSEIVTAYNPTYHNISYNISADGTTSGDQLQAFRGKSFEGNNFASANDIQVGDKVVLYGNLTKYNSIYEFEADNEVVSLKQPVTVSTANYRTFASVRAHDFTDVEGLTAYTASVSEKKVTFTAVTKAVPAGTGLLLKGEAATYYVPVVASAYPVEGNALIGVTEETSDVAAGIFVLMNGAKGVGFYKTTNTFTLGANTAYLPASVGSRLFIGFNDDGEETTGINGVKEMKENRAIYNLRGMRVTTPSKGLYIIGGKKVVIK